MTSINLVLKLRDALQMAADACQEFLESMAPADAKYNEEDFGALKWTSKTGTKGAYEQTTKEANENNEVFQVLQQTLSGHNGFYQTNSWKFWFHRENRDAIDRRKK